MKFTGLQAEFRFVMRIDEIELPVYDPIAGGIQCRLKLLYGTTCVLDVHQFADGRLVFTGCGQHALIERRRQKMKERKMRHHLAVRYLLVAAERHLPCRKGYKHHAARRKITFQAFQETGLVVDMLYHIVHQYQGEFMLQFRQFENVGCDKSTFRPSP